MITDKNNNKISPSKAPLANMQPVLFSVLSLFVVFITYQVFGGMISLFIYGEDLRSLNTDVNVARVVISFSQFMFILVPVLILNMLRGDSPKAAFRLRKPDTTVFLLGIAGVIIVQPALQSYMYLQNLALDSLPQGIEIIKQIKDLMDSLEAATMNLVTAYSAAEFVTVSFVIAVTPAICEEFFFRGLIFYNFEKQMFSVRAVFMTGFIFAIYHFHPFNLLPLIVLGYYLAFVVYYSNSIFTGIAAHFTFNFISAYMVYVYGKEGFENPDGTVMDNMPLLIAGIFSVFLFAVILIMIKRRGMKNIIKFEGNV